MSTKKKTLLSLFDITMIVIGLVIGMGIFRTASDSARAAITPNVFFFSWLAGGLIATAIIIASILLFSKEENKILKNKNSL